MQGFTLMEVVIVVALLSVISLMTIPVSVSQYRKYVVKESTLSITHFLRLSQNNAKTGLLGSSSGVKMLPDSFVVFVGDSYMFRNQAVDEVYHLPSSVSVEGVHEIVFEEITGIPTVSGRVEIFSGGYEYVISISDGGLIEIL